MINAPQGFIDSLAAENRRYQVLATVTLTTSEVLLLDNSKLWSSGFSCEDSIASNVDTLEVGSVVINKATFVIDNSDESYLAYDFTNAIVNVQIGLKPDDATPTAYIQKGVYTVDSVTYNGTLITLSCLDNMYKLDKPCVLSTTFPATVYNVVSEISTDCGVPLAVVSFDGDDVLVPKAPASGTTYRQLLSWIGQLIGCAWKVDTSGELLPVWYDLSPFDDYYVDDVFTYDESMLSDPDFITIVSGASASIAVDDTEVTGVKIKIANDPSVDTDVEPYSEYSMGTDGYVMVISDNPEITADNVSSVLTMLYNRVVGMRYRKGTVTHISDPRMESGDVFVYVDAKSRAYPMLCSQCIFKVGEYQSTTSASETPLRNASGRLSSSMQANVNTFQTVKREANAREVAIQALQQALADAPGLYVTPSTAPGGGTIFYLHDKEDLADSEMVIQITGAAMGVSIDGGQTYTWGFDFLTGTGVLNILNANGINADWLSTNNLYIRDINTNKVVATFGATLILGESDKTRAEIDYHSLQLIDRDNTQYLYISDLRDSTGVATVTSAFVGDGIERIFSFDVTATDTNYPVYVNNVEVTTGVTKQVTGIRFATPPAEGDNISATYNTTESKAKAYTLGKRYATSTIGAMSISEGFDTRAEGFACHSEGYVTRASSTCSHAEGNYTNATGSNSHAEGSRTNATRYCAHAEGNYTTASNKMAHAEGYSTTASGYTSHAEGYVTTASEYSSHAEGTHSVASGAYSHAQNYYTIARSRYQTAIGAYNIEDSSNTYAFIIGNGTADDARSNAFTVDWSGNINLKGTHISYENNGYPYNMITFKTGDQYGAGVAVGGGGLVVVGAGESADTVLASYNDGSSEVLELVSDGNVYLRTNVQNGLSDAKTFTFGTDGSFTVGTTSSYPFTAIYKTGVEVHTAAGATAYIGAYSGASANCIYIQCETDGRVTLGSRGANGTWYTILSRNNNAHEINTYGSWTFHGNIMLGACNLKTDYIKVVDYTYNTSKTVNAGTVASWDFTIIQSGYLPLGIVAFTGSGTSSFALIDHYLVDNTKARVYMRNVSSGSATITRMQIRVLYIRNSF